MKIRETTDPPLLVWLVKKITLSSLILLPLQHVDLHQRLENNNRSIEYTYEKYVASSICPGIESLIWVNLRTMMASNSRTSGLVAPLGGAISSYKWMA
jgi:hypothetical protein